MRAPKALADTFEAILAAIFLDGGWNALSSLFNTMFKPMLEFADSCLHHLGRDIVGDILRQAVIEGDECSFTDGTEGLVVSLKTVGGELIEGKGVGRNKKERKRKAAIDFVRKYNKRYSSSDHSINNQDDSRNEIENELSQKSDGMDIEQQPQPITKNVLTKY